MTASDVDSFRRQYVATLSSLFESKYAVDDDLRYRCLVCNTLCDNKDAVIAHFLAHTGEKANVCHECLSGFDSGTELIRHLAEESHVPRAETDDNDHHVVNRFCDECDASFRTEAELMEHNQVQHLMVNHFLDSGCVEEEEEDPKPFLCTVCQRAFETQRRLSKHITAVHPAGDQATNGTTDDVPRRPSLKMRIMFKKKSPKARAKLKIKSEKVKQGTNKVKRLSQEDREPFKCSQCPYTHRKRKIVRKHEKLHSGERPYKCATCPYAAATSKYLRRHEKTHGTERPFECDVCQGRFLTSGGFRSHYLIHSGARPFPCTVCGHNFRTSGQLHVHMRTHTGEKPYACTVCDYAASTKGSLVKHVRTHTGEKPFECSECPYRSAEPGDLKKHMRVHTGEKPYKCDQCSFAAARRDGLRVHVRGVHQKLPTHNVRAMREASTTATTAAVAGATW